MAAISGAVVEVKNMLNEMTQLNNVTWEPERAGLKSSLLPEAGAMICAQMIRDQFGVGINVVYAHESRQRPGWHRVIIEHVADLATKVGTASGKVLGRDPVSRPGTHVAPSVRVTPALPVSSSPPANAPAVGAVGRVQNMLNQMTAYEKITWEPEGAGLKSSLVHPSKAKYYAEQISTKFGVEKSVVYAQESRQHSGWYRVIIVHVADLVTKVSTA